MSIHILPPITPDWLREEIARVQCSTMHQYEIDRVVTKLETYISHMERHGVKSATWYGEFGPPLPARGSLVLLKAGAEVRSWMGKFNGKVNTRNRLIKVNRAYRGCWTGEYHHPGMVIEQPRVEWAGSGGYWVWTHPDNVELIAQPGGWRKLDGKIIVDRQAG